MKKMMIVAAVLALYGCSEDKIETYNAPNYVQFAEAADQITTVTFVFSPSATELNVPLRTLMSAAPLDRAQEFEIEVVADETTAVQGTHYVLPATMAFDAGAVESAPEITFRKTPDMDTESHKLTVRLVPNANFELGQAAYRTHTFVVHNMIARPDWWTTSGSGNVQTNYLGKYSNAKFRLMINVLGAGIGDWASYTDSQKRADAIKFKYWLAKQDPKIYDDDNSEPMTVTVKG